MLRRNTAAVQERKLLQDVWLPIDFEGGVPRRTESLGGTLQEYYYLEDSLPSQ